MTKRYSYFFVRQDLSREQQLVQTAHAALKLGASKSFKDDPVATHFVCVGVRNLDALVSVMQILDSFKFKYEIFIEPDLNSVDATGEETAIAVYPVDEDKRDVLLAFNLLKF